MPVSSALAQLLADRRKTFNARVARVRSQVPSFDTAAFSHFLFTLLDPLLPRILEVRPDGGAAFVDAGFDMGLALVEHGRGGEGPRGAVIGRLWQEVAPAIAVQIAANPRASLGALSNAAIKLAGSPGVNLTDWMTRLAQLGGKTTSPQELRALAIIAAWRSGAAHLRTAALSVAVDSGIAAAAVGASTEAQWPELVEHYAAQRWWTPDGSTPVNGHRLGQFIGFGGAFAEPPRLGVIDNQFVLSSVDQHFVLEADGYGAVLRRVAPDYAAAAVPAGPAHLTPDGHLRSDDRLVACEWSADGLMVAATGDSMAVVSSHAHAVQVFPRILP